MLSPAAGDNGPFWAGSEPESLAAQSHRPHVAKGIKHSTPKVTKHKSKRKTIVIIIMCVTTNQVHAATEENEKVIATSCNL